MQQELGVFSEKSLRRTGLVDLLMRAGFSVRSFHSLDALLHERLVRGVALLVVDLEMEEQPPSRLLQKLDEVMAGVPRVVVGTPLQIAALEAPQRVAAAVEDASTGAIVDSVRELLNRPVDGAARMVKGAAAGTSALSSAQQEALARLTRRQRDVMSWLAVGADNLKIAAELGVTERSIKFHVSALLERCSVENRTELALLSWRAGFRPPGGQ